MRLPRSPSRDAHGDAVATASNAPQPGEAKTDMTLKSAPN